MGSPPATAASEGRGATDPTSPSALWQRTSGPGGPRVVYGRRCRAGGRIHCQGPLSTPFASPWPPLATLPHPPPPPRGPLGLAAAHLFPIVGTDATVRPVPREDHLLPRGVGGGCIYLDRIRVKFEALPREDGDRFQVDQLLGVSSALSGEGRPGTSGSRELCEALAKEPCTLFPVHPAPPLFGELLIKQG